MFRDIKFYFHPAKLSKTRLNLFITKVTEHGGQVVLTSEQATHVLVEESCDLSALPSSLWQSSLCVGPLGSLWLSQCLKNQELVDENQFIIRKPERKRKSESTETEAPFTKKLQLDLVQIRPSDTETKKFACSQSSSKCQEVCRPNAPVLDQLQKLADAYRARGDQWRAHGYEKAISAIRRYGKEITDYEEVVTLEGVGAKMAAKVMEVISTGRLRKVEELCKTDESKVIELFGNVWGAGPASAHAWYIKGCRTLEDLVQKEKLTKQQEIGIKYYKEFMERIPRSEVEEIEEKVKAAALSVDSSLSTLLCGSYRRGKQTCGDVDVVVIKLDQHRSKDVLTAILSRLKHSGRLSKINNIVFNERLISEYTTEKDQAIWCTLFANVSQVDDRADKTIPKIANKFEFITDDLVSLEKNGNQRKYLGVCKLPGEETLHRRLDIFVVPRSESACAIMHYTGSALFNRSVRLLAAKQGKHLSEHSLSAGVARQGMEVLNDGHVLPTPTEESIFIHLGLEYRPPEERDH